MFRCILPLLLCLCVQSLPTNYLLSIQNGEALYRGLLGSECAMRIIQQLKKDCNVSEGQEINNAVAIVSASHLLDCAEKDLNRSAPLCGSSLDCIAPQYVIPWARLFANIENLCFYIDSANQSISEVIETIIQNGGGTFVIEKFEAVKQYLQESDIAKATISQLFWLPLLDDDFHFYRIIPYILLVPTSIFFACCCIYKRPLLCMLGSTCSEAILACLSGANGDYFFSIAIRYYWFFCAIHLNVLVKKMIRFYATKIVNYIEERKAMKISKAGETMVRRSTRGR